MRRSVVDEVFEAHEAQLLGQETSGFKSKAADLLQRRWVVPGLRERLIDFYVQFRRESEQSTGSSVTSNTLGQISDLFSVRGG